MGACTGWSITRLSSTCMALLPLHRWTRRSDDLYPVPCHILDEGGDVRRLLGRWRQRQRPGGFAKAGVPEVFLDSARRLGEELADDVGLEHERVGDAARQEDERARGSLVGLIADVERDLALQHIERLVLVGVDVAWRLRALAREYLDQREPPLGVLRTGQDSEEVAYVPDRGSRIHPACVLRNPFRYGFFAFRRHGLAPFPNQRIVPFPPAPDLVSLPVYKNKVSCLSCQGFRRKVTCRGRARSVTACRGYWGRASALWTGSFTRGWWRPGLATCVLPTTRCSGSSNLRARGWPSWRRRHG